MVADYSSVEVLTDTRFINSHVTSIRCIEQQVNFTKCMIWLLKSTQDELTGENLGSLDDASSRTSADTITKTIDHSLLSHLLGSSCVNEFP